MWLGALHLPGRRLDGQRHPAKHLLQVRFARELQARHDADGEEFAQRDPRLPLPRRSSRRSLPRQACHAPAHPLGSRARHPLLILFFALRSASLDSPAVPDLLKPVPMLIVLIRCENVLHADPTYIFTATFYLDRSYS